jgi:hypothetical protein
MTVFFLSLVSDLAWGSRIAYEVQIDKILVYGPQVSNSLEYEEYANLSISCTYSYLKPYSCANKEREKWTIGFYVDGKKMDTKKGIWPAKSSAIGVKQGQPQCLARFMTSFNWKTTAGPHVLRCVLNENREITGDVTNNNRRDKKIMVRKGGHFNSLTNKKAPKKNEEQTESIRGHSHLVIKSGTKKKQQ